MYYEFEFCQGRNPEKNEVKTLPYQGLNVVIIEVAGKKQEVLIWRKTETYESKSRKRLLPIACCLRGYCLDN
jgi:hypothetical protein